MQESSVIQREKATTTTTTIAAVLYQSGSALTSCSDVVYQSLCINNQHSINADWLLCFVEQEHAGKRVTWRGVRAKSRAQNSFYVTNMNF
jgi:hypothetical protein